MKLCSDSPCYTHPTAEPPCRDLSCSQIPKSGGKPRRRQPIRVSACEEEGGEIKLKMKKKKAAAAAASSTLTSSLGSGWCLHAAITHRILDLLDLPDYVQFAAVCKQWRSLQRENSRMLPFPWVVPSTIERHQRLLLCRSPFESVGKDEKTYQFTLPTSITDHDWNIVASSHGWLILLRQSFSVLGHSTFARFALLHPFSGTHIQLPELVMDGHLDYLLPAHAMSSDAYDLSCTLLVSDNYHTIFLWRACDRLRWLKLPLPFDPYRSYSGQRISHAVFVDGRFYCKRQDKALVIVASHHLLPQPVALQAVDMDCTQLPEQYSTALSRLLECNGQVLMVIGRTCFRADLSRNVWKRHGGCDRVLLLNEQTSFSLPNSSDLQAAFKARPPDDRVLCVWTRMRNSPPCTDLDLRRSMSFYELFLPVLTPSP